MADVTEVLLGPCAILRKPNGFAEACAKSHANAAEVAGDLRHPYIFSCHARLAGWAIPILENGKPLAATLICGGVFLAQPDSALIKHMERIAAAQEVDSAILIASLGSVPVVSRERLRVIADFLFELSNTFLEYAPSSVETPAPSQTPPPPVDHSRAPIVFPPVRRKQTKKAKQQQVFAVARQSKEAEIVRLLRERKPDEALQALRKLLMEESEHTASHGMNVKLNITETFARLFGNLAGDEQLPHGVLEKQSHLIHEAFSELPKKGAVPKGNLERLCQRFILVAEETTGEPRPRQVRTIQKFLEKNLPRKLTLGITGRKFGIKEKALNALMLKYCAMSFTDYVASLRVTEAKRLLQSANLSFGEIARRTGFKDQSYFTKVFKSHVGLTPTEFRSTLQTEKSH